MTVSVLIVTLNRPDCVRRCLECLVTQEPRPGQIIVIDASPDLLTRDVVAKFEGVEYLRNENGYGRMTASRNIGLKLTTGEIIAFVDDDAFPHPGWLENLVASYRDSTVGAVGGRALNNQPGEEILGVTQIGKLKRNGELTGNFAADPGKTIEVNHIIGCNMSFRREVLAKLGGLREEYLGTEVREETDICLRVKQIGYRILFNPRACVDHIGAPQVKGKRFDTRYAYYSQRNHLVLLVRNFGPRSPIVRRYVFHILFHSAREFLRKSGGASLRFLVEIGGVILGSGAGVLILRRVGQNPTRTDPEGRAISSILKASPASKQESIVSQENVVSNGGSDATD